MTKLPYFFAVKLIPSSFISITVSKPYYHSLNHAQQRPNLIGLTHIVLHPSCLAGSTSPALAPHDQSKNLSSDKSSNKSKLYTCSSLRFDMHQKRVMINNRSPADRVWRARANVHDAPSLPLHFRHCAQRYCLFDELIKPRHIILFIFISRLLVFHRIITIDSKQATYFIGIIRRLTEKAQNPHVRFIHILHL